MYGPIDQRDKELAHVLVNHSTRVQKGEVVMIHGIGLDTLGACSAVVSEVVKRGGIPFLKMEEQAITRDIVCNMNESQFQKWGEFEKGVMKAVQCYIAIRGNDNAFEMSGIPKQQQAWYTKHYVQPVVFEQRVKHTRWVVLRYPNNAMAQLAQKPRETFAEYYYRVCCTDYAHMAKAVKPLKALMEKTDQVHIVAPKTDLKFSIKGIPAIPCTGSHNIPDGECFTAPVKDSINGTVFFNAPTVYEGMPFDGIQLEFKNGKVVKAEASTPEQTKNLNGILDRDAGARYVGEFAIGFHPYITTAMRDILFDEKIAGSFHMALGQAYEEADNTNRSGIHWDMVQIQRPEQGGGEIYFNGKLIRKNGLFTVPALAGLNPDAYAKAGKKPAAKGKKK